MTNNMKLHRQVNTNTRRMKALMRDVKANIVRRTRNSKSIDDWMIRLSEFINDDFLITGAYSEEVSNIVKGIAKSVDLSGLKGANQELTKGVISECCYTYISNATKELQTEMQKIAIETYNTPGETNRDLARKLEERIDVFDKTRCRTIARTETMRASNLSNHIQAKNDGAMSYTVHCEEGACEQCIEEYGADEDTIYDIDDTANFPPYHPNCRCTPRYSTKTVEQRTQ